MLFRDSLVAVQLVHVLQVSFCLQEAQSFSVYIFVKTALQLDYDAIQFAVSFHPTQLHILMRVQKHST